MFSRNQKIIMRLFSYLGFQLTNSVHAATQKNTPHNVCGASWVSPVLTNESADLAGLQAAEINIGKTLKKYPPMACQTARLCACTVPVLVFCYGSTNR